MFGRAVQVVPMRTSVFESEQFNVDVLAHDIAADGFVLYNKREFSE